MLKCPFCNFHNEDGALFCEQCKSDLASVASAPAAPAAAPVMAVEAVGEAVPMAAVIEEEPIPMAAVEPVAAMAIAETPPAAPVAPPPAPVAEAAPAPAPAAPVAEGPKLADDAKPKLVVIRGQKINAEFPIYEGLNFIGRADEKPVDIDLEDQEPADRIWCSRQHACISLEGGVLAVEDLNSANGTYVNRARIYPGQKKQLNVNDVVQIGTVQMKVKV
ncbi:MAG TPA: FHA domain-containing protein [Gemmataceae bacterium]|nr:FHA domain-containing protein [Gemmataceae bacterium]